MKSRVNLTGFSDKKSRTIASCQGGALVLNLQAQGWAIDLTDVCI